MATVTFDEQLYSDPGDLDPEPELYSFDDDPSPPIPNESSLDALSDDLIAMAHLDCACFVRLVFGWKMFDCHNEWQELFDREERLVLWAPVEHGKTSQLTGRILWELGKNPNARIGIISNTAGLAMKILGSVKQHILLNPLLGPIFPKLRPETRRHRFAAWHTDKIVVERDDLDNKDYSVQALGIGGQLIGSRLDRAYLDDVLNFKNTLHELARKQTREWFDSTVEGRISAEGKIAIIGTAWHKQDLMHEIAARRSWASKKYDATEMLWPEAVRINGKLCGWPAWRLEKKRASIPPLEFNRQFRCIALSPESQIFRTEAIEQCFVRDEPWDPEPRNDWLIYCGVDLNVKKKESLHETSFFIGRAEGPYRVVLNIITRNMGLSELARTFMEIEARYHPVLFLVENVAAQDYVAQMFHPETLQALLQSFGASLPIESMRLIPRVEGFSTGSNKHDPLLGIRGMTIEFEQRRWRIPDHPETRKWSGQLQAFTPEDHTGDMVMASWLFSNAVTRYRPRSIISRSVSARR